MTITGHPEDLPFSALYCPHCGHTVVGHGHELASTLDGGGRVVRHEYECSWPSCTCHVYTKGNTTLEDIAMRYPRDTPPQGLANSDILGVEPPRDDSPLLYQLRLMNDSLTRIANALDAFREGQGR